MHLLHLLLALRLLLELLLPLHDNALHMALLLLILPLLLLLLRKLHRLIGRQYARWGLQDLSLLRHLHSHRQR